jgi:HAD superfamily hydrolase (TIGR01509 family)
VSKLIIFDCDGVLVDSEMIANKIDAEALTKLGYPLTAEESIRKFTGLSGKSVVSKIFEESNILLPEDYFTLRQPNLLKAFEKELSSLIVPVLEVLEEKNIQKCVASSSLKSRVMHCLKITNQMHFFKEENIFTSQLVERGKPFPDLFLHAAKNLRFDPKDCIVIEDSAAGVEAAIAANMQVIGFLGGSHAGYDWYEKKVNAYCIPVAKNKDDLLNLLQEMISYNFFS